MYPEKQLTLTAASTIENAILDDGTAYTEIRSEDDVSNRRKRKGKQKFVMLHGYLLRSEAWRHLTPIARCAYVELKLRFDGLNNGAIGLGCRELGLALNMGRDTASRALQELQDKGFIEKAKPSSFHTKNRTATEWRLTEETCHVTGALPTNEFMRWQPEKALQFGSQVNCKGKT